MRTQGHSTLCPYKTLPGPAQQAPWTDEQDQQEDDEGDDVLVGAAEVTRGEALQQPQGETPEDGPGEGAEAA